jgi:hypothetical protein
MSASLFLGMPAAAGQTDEMYRFHSKDDKSVGLSTRFASFAQPSKWRREKGKRKFPSRLILGITRF